MMPLLAGRTPPLTMPMSRAAERARRLSVTNWMGEALPVHCMGKGGGKVGRSGPHAPQPHRTPLARVVALPLSALANARAHVPSAHSQACNDQSAAHRLLSMHARSAHLGGRDAAGEGDAHGRVLDLERRHAHGDVRKVAGGALRVVLVNKDWQQTGMVAGSARGSTVSSVSAKRAFGRQGVRPRPVHMHQMSSRASVSRKEHAHIPRAGCIT